MLLEPIWRFVSECDYGSKAEPVPRLLLDQAKMCLSMFEVYPFAIQSFSAGDTWTTCLGDQQAENPLSCSQSWFMEASKYRFAKQESGEST